MMTHGSRDRFQGTWQRRTRKHTCPTTAALLVGGHMQHVRSATPWRNCPAWGFSFVGYPCGAHSPPFICRRFVIPRLVAGMCGHGCPRDAFSFIHEKSYVSDDDEAGTLAPPHVRTSPYSDITVTNFNSNDAVGRAAPRPPFAVWTIGVNSVLVGKRSSSSCQTPSG